MFRVADLKFEVTKGELTAYVHQQLSMLIWNVSVTGEPKKIVEIDTLCTPSARTDFAFCTKAGEISNWREIINRTSVWDASYSAEYCQERGLLYMFEHCPIYNSSLKLLSSESTGVRVDWIGHADVFIGDKYGKGVRFHIQSDLLFSVGCAASPSEAIAREQLRPYLDDSLLVYDSTKPKRLRPK